MSGKRSKRRRRLQEAGVQIAHDKRDVGREAEILNRLPSDQMKALLAKLGVSTEAEALEIMLKLQEAVRGPASLLQNPEMGDEVAKMRQRAVERDAAVRRFEEDSESFINEVMDKADKIRPVGEKADQIKANAAKIAQRAYADARVKQAYANKKLDDMVEHGPREVITVAPKFEQVRIGDNIEQRAIPELIRIRHRAWNLYPGTYEVPSIVAQRYRDIMRGRAETEARKKAMAKGQRDTDMVNEFARINKQFGSDSPLPQAVGLY